MVTVFSCPVSYLRYIDTCSTPPNNPEQQNSCEVANLRLFLLLRNGNST